MANIIKIRHGLKANLGSVEKTQNGELLVTTDDKKIYMVFNDALLLLNPDATASETAQKLETARTITYTGGATGSMSFDGSQDVSCALTLSDIDLSKIPGLGTVAGLDTGTSEGDIPVLGSGGLLPPSVIPSVAINEIYVVATEAEMLALDVQSGDVAVRTDKNETYILKQEPANVLANWVLLLTPESPVSSVNGQVGAVVLTKADVGLNLVDNTADSAKEVLSATKLKTGAAINGVNFDGSAAITVYDNTKAPLDSPAFINNPTAPTQATDDDSTKLATTAFVKAQGYLTPNSIIDCGTF